MGFLNPWLLAGLLGLPVIWWLLRILPPRPRLIVFPPTRLLQGLQIDGHTPKHSPWWLTALRMQLVALVIVALARPVLNPDREALTGSGPVVVALDNGWAAASHWSERLDFMDMLIARAERENRPVIIAPSATDGAIALAALKAERAREVAASLKPLPFDPDRPALAASISQALAGHEDTAIIWLSDGLDYGAAEAFATSLKFLTKASGGLTIVRSRVNANPIGLYASIAKSGALSAHVIRVGDNKRRGQISALSSRGERLSETQFELDASARKTSVPFAMPLEIRNQVTRLEIEGERSAGAVHLLDARSQWNRVGIISGESRDAAQPLLSPLYYVERALKPYAEIVSNRDRNLVSAVQQVLETNVSVLILADIGKLVGGTLEDLEKWVQEGGTLVRFAGPRLEQGGDRLLPQALRRGGRALGGSLSWSSPQPLAPFEEESPFFGIEPPSDIVVHRQVLSDPAEQSQSQTWARLQDGTPLVSTAKHGDGRLILFHVGANSEWSNLPMSGLFVHMLRRIVERSSLTSKASGDGLYDSAGSTEAEGSLLTPQRVLNGFGQLETPTVAVSPLKKSQITAIKPGPGHPPGFYGPVGASHALNLIGAHTVLTRLPNVPEGIRSVYYGAHHTVELKPWLLAAALILFFTDAIAVLALSTRSVSLRPARAMARGVTGLAISAAIATVAPPARAEDKIQHEAFALKAALKTRLAFVITGDTETDRISEAGLTGLAKVLTARTTVEPSEPMGVDVHRDELAFFPMLYWPVRAKAKALPDKTLARVDAYMKQGGIILFDTRDFHLSAGASNRFGQGPGAIALAHLIGKLDIPPLAPVPETHVLTKSFYLLREFPGRWDSNVFWAEAAPDHARSGAGRARQSDGVSSILITSNDFAAAWALDEHNTPLFPVVPGGEMQREMAFRSGINIVMYALTGNYKADQVHVPALLERLGQ